MRAEWRGCAARSRLVDVCFSVQPRRTRIQRRPTQSPQRCDTTSARETSPTTGELPGHRAAGRETLTIPSPCPSTRDKFGVRLQRLDVRQVDASCRRRVDALVIRDGVTNSCRLIVSLVRGVLQRDAAADGVGIARSPARSLSGEGKHAVVICIRTVVDQVAR